MKLTFIILLSFFSLASFAGEGKFCLTNGDCQVGTETEQGYKCLVVKTGQDYNQNTTCALQCFVVELGNNCKITEGQLYGRCMKESFDVPVFDPNDPNRCSQALEVTL